jgi:hypothetical protein
MADLEIVLRFRDNSTCKWQTKGNLTSCVYKDFDKTKFIYKADDNTTVKEIYEYAITIINNFDDEFKNKYVIEYDTMAMFFIENDSRSVSRLIEDPRAKILSVLNYLGIPTQFKLFNCRYGIGANWNNLDGIRYYVHSDEQNHKHSPHIHTEYNNKKSSYFILSGDKRDGENYPRKIEKSIKKQMADNKKDLLEFWNDRTNGVVPINYPLSIEVLSS